jgi:rhodanese-related sulfurtransferase
VALLLQKKGINRVRPLDGGIDAWLGNNFPCETLVVVTEPSNSVPALSQ